MNRRLILSLVISVLIAAGISTATVSNSSPARTSSAMFSNPYGNEKQYAFRNGMRKLWEDHITWTRVFIISAVADLPDKDAATQRLLQNQVDIGNAIKPFYGDAAGDRLALLLKEHKLLPLRNWLRQPRGRKRRRWRTQSAAGMQMLMLLLLC